MYKFVDVCEFACVSMVLNTLIAPTYFAPSSRSIFRIGRIGLFNIRDGHLMTSGRVESSGSDFTFRYDKDRKPGLRDNKKRSKPPKIATPQGGTQ